MISERNFFLQHLAQTSPEPLSLEIVKASGIYLIDKQKKRYIDLISGISVSTLGHRHPEVIRSIQRQLKKYLHVMVYGEMIQSPQVRLATALSQYLPQTLSSIYFVNSGSEAIEGAMKLAKRFTGRYEIISFKNAYHGSTHGALSIMGDEYFKNAFRPLLPGTKQLEFNNLEDLKNINCKTAAVIVEPIQGEAGAVPANSYWLKELRKRCNDTGSLLVFDEIQSGYGRTGKMFAFEHDNIHPDILVLAKAFGGGMPLGAFISSKEIMKSISENPVLGHITTFGGHPVCCAAGLATFKILRKSNLIQQVSKKEYLFRKYLNHSAIKTIHGKGLLLALEFENEQLNKKVIHQCIKNGVLTDWFLFNPKSMRIAPPLIITEEQIKKACSKINKSIEEAIQVKLIH